MEELPHNKTQHTKSHNQQKLVSIVVPVYNEEANVPLLVRELIRNAKQQPYAFEFLLVDDGSTDNSVDAIQRAAAEDERIKLVQLARNFGKEAAVSAGLAEARGDAVLIMDADLQMPPALMGKFFAKWEQGAEVVVGVFAERNMSKFRAFGARNFYRIMGKIGSTKITPNATDFRLLDREVVDVFNNLTERNRITRGLIDWLGFQRDYIYFKSAPRQNGEPTYSVKKLIQLAINSFTAHSLLPLKLAGYLGIFILTLSIPLGVGLAVLRFVFHDPYNWGIHGTMFLAVLNLFSVGVVLACLGLVALYIAHIHAEVINRPLYIVRRKPTRSVQQVVDDSDVPENAKADERVFSNGEVQGA
ncbi:MAG TPA: glycosyltransferase family 2 protein [Candidatus Saccharimonadales bacterium]|nr:glycosyltransferase family 2 protein [Candidatus Saccharimonadales bacterium]